MNTAIVNFTDARTKLLEKLIHKKDIGIFDINVTQKQHFK